MPAFFTKVRLSLKTRIALLSYYGLMLGASTGSKKLPFQLSMCLELGSWIIHSCTVIWLFIVVNELNPGDRHELLQMNRLIASLIISLLLDSFIPYLGLVPKWVNDGFSLIFCSSVGREKVLGMRQYLL